MIRIPTLVALVGCASDFGIRADAERADFPDEQPLSPGEREDRFVQSPSDKSDVLFVIDSSGSMAEEQDALATNFPVFLAWFLDSGVDYHIGVISTDMYDPEHTGRLVSSEGERWIEPATVDADGRFAAMTRLGTDGANDERGRAAAYTALALRDDGANAGFLREDAFLHVIVVSDEEDNSGRSPVSVTDFVDFLDEAAPEPQGATFSSVVGPPALLGLEPFDCDAEPGWEYLEVTRRVGGVARSICDDDWAGILEDLGFVAIGLRRSFHLQRPAVPRTIEIGIEVGEERFVPPIDDWTYDVLLDAVVFADRALPPPGAVLYVRYVVDDGG